MARMFGIIFSYGTHGKCEVAVGGKPERSLGPMKFAFPAPTGKSGAFKRAKCQE
jgi:hypothetical protein